MKRGDVYWVNLDPTQGSEIKKRRPGVIMSANPINKARRTVIIIPLSTSAKPNPPITIAVNCLGKKTVAVCDQIRAVDKTRLAGEVADALSAKDLKKLEDGVRQVLVL